MEWDQWAALIFTGVYTVGASAGFWKFFSQKQNEKEAELSLLLGITHKVFHDICDVYISQGWVNREEYEVLLANIYTPYKTLGGNGTADLIMKELSELPLRSGHKFSPNLDLRTNRRKSD
jgi:hypothetical protein